MLAYCNNFISSFASRFKFFEIDFPINCAKKMWVANKNQIMNHLKGYQSTLDDLLEAINDEDSEKLGQLFTTAKKTRDSWLG